LKKNNFIGKLRMEELRKESIEWIDIPDISGIPVFV
jgi:hypothetical protein